MSRLSAVATAVLPGLVFTTLIAALSLATVSRADDDAEHLLVTGTRTGSDWHDNASALSWVDASDLDSRRPSSMGDVLNALPGVFWVDLGNEQHAMSIRQPLSYNAVYLYLEDGIPIRPLGLFNHNALNEVNLAGAGQIEVLKGPASSLYGSNAVGGAVNFLTEAARDNHRRLQLRGDDQGYARVDLQAGQLWQDGGLQFSHYSAERRGGWQENADMDKSTTSLRVDQQLSAQTRIWLTASHSDLQTGMPGSLNETDYRNDPGKSYNDFTWRSDLASRLTGFIEHDLTDRDQLRAALFWRRNSHAQLPSYLIFNTSSTTASGRQNDNQFQSRGTDLYWRHVFDSALLTDLVTGVYVDRTPNDYDESNLAISRDPVSGRYLDYTVTTVRRDYRTDISNDAWYGQLRGQFAGDWLWQLGLREDRIRYDFDNHLLPSNSTGPASEHRSFSHLSPKLGLVYRLAEQQSLFASASQGFVPPEVSSQYGRLEAPNLREAVFDNLELGWRGQWSSLRADATIYQLDGEDELVSYNIAPGVSEPRNAGATRHRGLELGIEYAMTEQWALQFAGALAKHEYRDYAVSASLNYDGMLMKQAPERLLQSSLSWMPTEAWLLRLTAVHVSDYWMDDANTVRYPGHDLLQLYGRWQHDALTVFAGISNLTDSHYSEAAAYSGNASSYSPGAPRTLSLGLSWDW